MILVLMDFYFSVSIGGLSGPAMFGFLKLIPDSGMYGYSMLSIFMLFCFVLSYFLYYSFRRTSFIASVLSFLIIIGASFIYKAYSGEGLYTSSLPGVLVKKVFGLKINRFIDGRLFYIDVNFKPIISGSFLKQHISIEKPKVISIIVESLGVPKDENLKFYIENKFKLKLGDRMVSFSASTSKGATINGEIRELCSMETDSIVIASIPDNVRCIPKFFDGKKIYTAAYHNNNGDVYDRILWYKSAGFNDFYDKRKLFSMGYNHVHSNLFFSGISDKEMTEAIIKNARSHDAYFIHWMTLDSHGPYSELYDKKINQFRCLDLNVKNELECNYMKLIDNTIDSIIQMIQMLPEADFIISGDHEPHFQDITNPNLIKEASDSFYMNRVLSIYIKSK